MNISELLKNAKNIAIVGLSPKPGRASAMVAHYLISRGYRVIPVNPMYGEIFGLQSYASLLDIPRDIKVDIVDVFRKAEDTPTIAMEAVKIGASCLWLQLGITSEESQRISVQGGIDFIQDRCIKVEHNFLLDN